MEELLKRNEELLETIKDITSNKKVHGLKDIMLSLDDNLSDKFDEFLWDLEKTIKNNGGDTLGNIVDLLVKFGLGIREEGEITVFLGHFVTIRVDRGTDKETLVTLEDTIDDWFNKNNVLELRKYFSSLDLNGESYTLCVYNNYVSFEGLEIPDNVILKDIDSRKVKFDDSTDLVSIFNSNTRFFRIFKLNDIGFNRKKSSATIYKLGVTDKFRYLDTDRLGVTKMSVGFLFNHLIENPYKADYVDISSIKEIVPDLDSLEFKIAKQRAIRWHELVVNDKIAYIVIQALTLCYSLRQYFTKGATFTIGSSPITDNEKHYKLDIRGLNMSKEVFEESLTDIQKDTEESYKELLEKGETLIGWVRIVFERTVKSPDDSLV